MDLPQSVWREIEKAARTALVDDGFGTSSPSRPYTIRAVELGKLRTILKKSRRTNEQNALLWSLYEDVLKQGGEALGGWTKEDLHEFALGSYFGWQRCDAFGMKRQKPKRRSSRLSKSEFADFVEAFVRQMAEHGIVLELPGEQWPQ